MTPEQNAELVALKSALKQHIDEAEKATPEPWTQDYIYVDTPNKAMFIKADGNSNNAAFIARARTMSPLACKLTLAAIKALEEINAEDKDHAMGADGDLVYLLSIWKGGQP